MTIYHLFDYFDACPIEQVGNLDRQKQATLFFAVFKLFVLILLYLLFFTMAKFVKFIFSELFTVPLEDVKLIYFVLPLLYMSELGGSKLNSIDLLHQGKFILRAAIKFLIVFGIDFLL